ncbi:MAG TPA: hypothetical protein DDZ88_28005 [Verrucomicrobiales bacterium]|nr:hypothetical protein [Verrucomicrobiales bacterium]
MIVLSTFAHDQLWVLSGCLAAYMALFLWSCRSVRHGKPAIPRNIILLLPLGAYVFFLQCSLPLTAPAAARSPSQRSYAEENTTLRHDLDDALTALDQLRSINNAMLNLAWLAIVVIVSSWLVNRLDDRNWIHGGIRPPPDAPDQTSPGGQKTGLE